MKDFRPITTPPPKLLEGKLYFEEGTGRVHCGAARCAGMTAYLTGRSLYGGRIRRLTKRFIEEVNRDYAENDALAAPWDHKCEGCGCRE